jgi:hypothetical protein
MAEPSEATEGPVSINVVVPLTLAMELIDLTHATRGPQLESYTQTLQDLRRVLQLAFTQPGALKRYPNRPPRSIVELPQKISTGAPQAALPRGEQVTGPELPSTQKNTE